MHYFFSTFTASPAPEITPPPASDEQPGCFLQTGLSPPAYLDIESALPLVPKWSMYLAGVLGMAGMSIRIIQRRVGEFRSAGKDKQEE